MVLGEQQNICKLKSDVRETQHRLSVHQSCMSASGEVLKFY